VAFRLLPGDEGYIRLVVAWSVLSGQIEAILNLEGDGAAPVSLDKVDLMVLRPYEF